MGAQGTNVAGAARGQLLELVRERRIGALADAASGAVDAVGARAPWSRAAGEEPLTGFEALSWKLAATGVRPDFTNLTVLSGAPDPGRLRARISAVIDVLPQLRQRVEPGRWPAGPPTWRDDPWFDIDDHVTTLACPAPGGLPQLLDLAEQVTAEPFPPDRPLWNLTLVEGLAGGRTALVQQVHHAVTDGAGGVRALAVLFATEGDALAGAGPDRAGVTTPRPRAPLLDSLGRLARLDRTSAWAFARHQLLLGRRPASSLMAGRGPAERRFGAHSLHLQRVRRAARVLGGSRNDLLVAGVAGALHDYHRRMGRSCEELRVAVPMLRRSGRRQVGGNDLTVATLRVPTCDQHPVERFGSVRERLGELAADPGLGLSDVGLGLLGALPAPVLTTLATAHNGAIDVVVSGVPGMRTRGDLGGAPVEASYPFGPRVGAALNVTALRCHDRIDLGLNLDPVAITEPDLLLDCVVGAFEALLAAGEVAA